MAENWKNLKISDEILSVIVDHFKFERPTEVQKKCVPSFLNHKDVIVEAPTGSGKTLAYLIPVFHMLQKSMNERKAADHVIEKWTNQRVGALILVPNRELALQIRRVAQPFLDRLKITCSILIGGTKIDKDVKTFEEQGGNVIIATPGRLDELLENGDKFSSTNFANCFKSLQILILDEADRLFEQTFSKNLTSILERLPKQRRTGLFSATQTQYQDELCKVGLRNPETIVVKDNNNQSSEMSGGVKYSTPSTLENYYTIVDPFQKFAALCKFIENHRSEKLLIFMSCCACVDYFGRLLKATFEKAPKKKKRRRSKVKKPTISQNNKDSTISQAKESTTISVLTIHGKKKVKRAAIFQRFAEATASVVLVCTDVMARGIDVPGIDWVLQYDVPRSASFFVHRCGRTARNGLGGKALLFLTESEYGYVDFLIRNQNVDLKPLLNSNLNTNMEKHAENLFENIRKMASKDRSLLLKGTKAFVSFIQSYAKHDCGIVCRLADLDVVNTAHAFGLLRLPKMPELYGRDLSTFRRCAINTADVPYKDKTMERKRLDSKKAPSSLNKDPSSNKGPNESLVSFKSRKNQVLESHEKWDSENAGYSNPATNNAGCYSDSAPNSNNRKRPLKVRKRDRVEKFNVEDMQELDDDYKLIKRLKKGKISKTQFDTDFV